MSEVADTHQMFCPQCGGRVDADARFCKHCAFDLTKSGQSSEPPVIASNKQSNRKTIYMLLAGGLAVVLLIPLAGILIFKGRRAPTDNMVNARSPTPSPSLTMSDRAKQVEEKILRGESLTESDIAGLSAYELRVLRNVHFARYGRRYDRGGLGDYFYTRPWYQPSDTYNDSMITSTDRANINLILIAERADSNSDVASANTGSTTAATDNSLPVSSSQSSTLEEQAVSHVRRMVEDRWFTRCGDSYFSQDMQGNALTGYAGSLAQRRNPSYIVSEIYSLTEADRLNEIRYRGRVQFRYSAMRVHSTGGWSDWQTYQERPAYSFSVSLRGANWQAQGATYLLDTRYRKIDCSNAPR